MITETYTITVDNESSFDALKLKRAVVADDLFYVVSTLLSKLRDKLKHDNLSPEDERELECIRDYIMELLEEQSINLDNLYP